MLYSDYYYWLESLVDDGCHYTLLRYLYENQYRWQFALDENRSAGGINLRRRYAYDNGVDISDVGVGPCSILEMLIALADRMTEFMECSNNQISTWFWVMIQNLGLHKYDDMHFDENKVKDILDIWLDRHFLPDGTGSLFPLKLYSGDCRNLDTWGQMNAWISETFPHTDDWLKGETL